MIYSQKQLDAFLKKMREETSKKLADKDQHGTEHQLLLRLEAEVRKAFHPATEDTFNGQEVDHLLTRLDILRAEAHAKFTEDEDDET